MERFIDPIITGIICSILAAMGLTVPYMIHCYRKYGSVLFMRVTCMFFFILYLICVYCLAILPFPDSGTVVTQRTQINLIPFSYVPEILTKQVDFSWSNPRTWLSAAYSSGLYEPVCNILMFFPLGVFLRYYFGYGKLKVTLIALAGSLFLELTQLSATYGLAPFVYRCCDVNDLIDNTLGGFLGYLATPLLTFFLPSRERLDQVSRDRGERVSYVRRGFAYAADAVLIELSAVAIAILLSLTGMPTMWQGLLSQSIAITLLMGVVPWRHEGRTPGKALVRIRMVDDRTRQTGRFWQYEARGLALHLLFLRVDLVLKPLLIGAEKVDRGLWALSGLFFLLLVLCAIWHAVHNEPQMGYEEWTHLIQINDAHKAEPSVHNACLDEKSGKA